MLAARQVVKAFCQLTALLGADGEGDGVPRAVVAFTIMIAACGFAAGCAIPHLPSARPRGLSGEPQFKRHYLIFNPSWNTWPMASIQRSEWPFTVAYQGTGEVIRYRKTFIDIQGRFGRGRGDYIHRRFSSTRTGQAYR